MISKFLRPTLFARSLLIPGCKTLHQTAKRCGELVPATQYDVPLPPRLHLIHALKTYWELIPLFLITCTSLTCMTLSLAWAYFHKVCIEKYVVDVVYTTHNRENISRTMDLRNPTAHKILIINQRYEPWPEMQDALDKMKMAEKRALVRLQSCGHA